MKCFKSNDYFVKLAMCPALPGIYRHMGKYMCFVQAFWEAIHLLTIKIDENESGKTESEDSAVSTAAIQDTCKATKQSYKVGPLSWCDNSTAQASATNKVLKKKKRNAGKDNHEAKPECIRPWKQLHDSFSQKNS